MSRLLVAKRGAEGQAEMDVRRFRLDAEKMLLRLQNRGSGSIQYYMGPK